jgi:hypothetical protein
MYEKSRRQQQELLWRRPKEEEQEEERLREELKSLEASIKRLKKLLRQQAQAPSIPKYGLIQCMRCSVLNSATRLR